MSVSDAGADSRAEFVRKTYAHLAWAVAGFIALEYYLLKLPGIEGLVYQMTGSTISWLVVLGVFMVVSWVADKWARSAVSKPMQYAGLALYVAAEAVIFVPMLYIAQMYFDGIILQAGIITGALFFGLTATALLTRKDFSFLKSFLVVGGFIALGMIVVAAFTGLSLGLWFSGAMAVFASVAVLYTTSNVLHEYQPGQHVAASLALFAAVALLFWYVLRILMSLSGRD